MSTLRDLIASGDEIVRIEGILSGTLSYLFNTFDGSVPFSALVRDAHRMGFTEPDPREDLSGQDVARKLLILARADRAEDGSRRGARRQPGADGAARGTFTPRFFRRSRARRRDGSACSARGRAAPCCATSASLEGGRARAGAEGVPARSSVRRRRRAATTSSRSRPKRYARTPLVVQGPGAGADVTAMGVFSDILKLLHYLPQ